MWLKEKDKFDLVQQNWLHLLNRQLRFKATITNVPVPDSTFVFRLAEVSASRPSTETDIGMTRTGTRFSGGCRDMPKSAVQQIDGFGHVDYCERAAGEQPVN